ncbi:hypothetical protein [Streptomyces sp. I05A-00742]|uniref:hypothetical protein n=1 Tax=Streptomyces sp. I05A-00742 TaxID=2732853 RepID=UPI001BB1D724|nr:hypothetical protein [Streptomyces sp. I05A-00742]
MRDETEASGRDPRGSDQAGGKEVPRGPRAGREFEKGDVVRDTRNGRIGVVMDKVGPRYQLRAPAGGREWEAGPADMERAQAPDRMKAKVAEANAASRRRGGVTL